MHGHFCAAWYLHRHHAAYVKVTMHADTLKNKSDFRTYLTGTVHAIAMHMLCDSTQIKRVF